MAAQRRNVGRVIFRRTRQGRPEWTVLTLRNHVENVAHLAEMWDCEKAYLNTGHLDLDTTRQRLILAARIHDIGKPAKFRIQYRQSLFNNNAWQWTYSFRGHRFEVFDDDPYVQVLARLHHEYSVEGITKAMATLRGEDFPYAANLPLDLYTLEMCDQIEASAAHLTLGDQPNERVFMDFCLEKLDARNLGLDPFPFHQDKIQLNIEYSVLYPPGEVLEQAGGGTGKERSKAETSLTGWVVDNLQSVRLDTSEVAICPLVTP